MTVTKNNLPAVALGIISVYNLGIFPLLLQHTSDYSKVVVALCSVVQILFSWTHFNLQALAFVGAWASAFVLAQPEISYIVVGACFGSYYSQFLNGIEYPEKALRIEFLAQILFLAVCALILIVFDRTEYVIILSGILWVCFTPDWAPTFKETAGNNWLFLIGWSALSASISGFLLVAVFLVGIVYDDEQENKAIIIGLSLLLFGGCISTISFDNSLWIKSMSFGSMILFMCGITAGICKWSSLNLIILAYGIGLGIGSVMTSVRTAYGGHYGVLLGLQRTAEAVPAIVLATTSEITLLFVSSILALVSLIIFIRVSILERQRPVTSDHNTL